MAEISLGIESSVEEAAEGPSVPGVVFSQIKEDEQSIKQ